MRVINIEFRRADQWSLIDLMDAIGVYSLWSGRASVRPTYIGEGLILHRIVKDHMEDSIKISGTTFDGMIGVLGHRPDATPKEEAQIVEALLLDVAELIDRYPTQNKKGGNRSKVSRIFNTHGTLKINFRGLDPLRDPGSPIMVVSKQIVLRADDPFPQHDWNRRVASVRR